MKRRDIVKLFDSATVRNMAVLIKTVAWLLVMIYVALTIFLVIVRTQEEPLNPYADYYAALSTDNFAGLFMNNFDDKKASCYEEEAYHGEPSSKRLMCIGSNDRFSLVSMSDYGAYFRPRGFEEVGWLYSYFGYPQALRPVGDYWHYLQWEQDNFKVTAYVRDAGYYFTLQSKVYYVAISRVNNTISE